MPVAAPAVVPDTAARRRMWRQGTFAFVMSRAFVFAGAATVAVFKAKADPITRVKHMTATRDAVNVLTDWDGQWYVRIVRTGYPRHIPANITYSQNQARAAFFPLYPRLAHALDRVLPGGSRAAALTLAWGAGIVAIALIGVLAADLYGPRVGGRAMVLASFFPGSFVLSFAYSESVLLVLAAATLLFLHRRHWLAAGICAGFATAARPNAIALCLACLVAAIIAVRERKEWWALVAPALSPVGYIGFHIFLAHHAGESWPWFRVQREAWHEGVSLGLTALRGVANALIHPISSPTNMITLFTMVAMVAMVWMCRKVGMPVVWWAYSLAVLFLMLLPNTVAPRPRFLFTAFPLVIGAAAWWPERDRDGWAYTLAVCAGSLVALVAVYGGAGAVP